MTPPTIAPTGVVDEERFEALLMAVEVGATELELEGRVVDEEKGTVSMRVVVERGGAEVTVTGGTLLDVERVEVVDVLRVVVSQGAKRVLMGVLTTVRAGKVARMVEVNTLSVAETGSAHSILYGMGQNCEGMCD